MIFDRIAKPIQHEVFHFSHLLKTSFNTNFKKQWQKTDILVAAFIFGDIMSMLKIWQLAGMIIVFVEGIFKKIDIFPK
jgi:hypothetical protein